VTVSIRWYPDHTNRSSDPPAPGDLIAWEHAVWRVLAVEVKPESEWTDEERRSVMVYKRSAWNRIAPATVTARPILPATVGPAARREDLNLNKAAGWFDWHIYQDEHYPVCAQCGEPTPCRDRLGLREAEQAMRKMSRYETTGVCPACSEVISGRQKSVTFTENMEIPAGPPVTFHAGRGGCRHSAAQYEQRWVDADPAHRRTTLSCPGDVTTHNDGTYDCTESRECRGPDAFHPSYATCECLDCHARGRFGCGLASTAVLRLSDIFNQDSP
jgi:hypothetical protein